MKALNQLLFVKWLLLVFIAIVSIGGCGDDSDKKERMPKGEFNCCAAPFSDGLETESNDICLPFEEVESSDCPAVDALSVCEPYFCEGCTDEFCVDFNFPEAFTNCQAIDCHTIDCDGVYDIQVDVYPSWTTIIDDEEICST